MVSENEWVHSVFRALTDSLGFRVFTGAQYFQITNGGRGALAGFREPLGALGTFRELKGALGTFRKPMDTCGGSRQPMGALGTISITHWFHRALVTFKELTGAAVVASVHEIAADTGYTLPGSRTGHTLSSTRAL